MRNIRSLIKYQETTIGPILKEALKTKGKGFRSIVACEVAQALDSSVEIPASILTRMELLHYSTLIHDDMIDQSQLRRGTQSLWKQFSPEIALLMGNFIHGSIYDFSDIIDDIESDKLVQLSTLFSQAYLKAHAGELLETINRNNHNLSLLSYFRIARGKTSSLIELAVLIGWLFSSADTSVLRRLRRFALTFGLSYQIYNDIIDFLPGSGDKSELEDVRLGIPTFPILLFYQDKLANHMSYTPLETLAMSDEKLSDFLADLYQSGVLYEAAQVCRSLALRAGNHIEVALGCPPPKEIREILSRFESIGNELSSCCVIAHKSQQFQS